MTPTEIEQYKKEIDNLNQEQMCYAWRFSSIGHPYFQPELSEYFCARFKELGGFTPEISKKIGWNP
jgi:hypothetical protein